MATTNIKRAGKASAVRARDRLFAGNPKGVRASAEILDITHTCNMMVPDI